MRPCSLIPDIQLLYKMQEAYYRHCYTLSGPVACALTFSCYDRMHAGLHSTAQLSIVAMPDTEGQLICPVNCSRIHALMCVLMNKQFKLLNTFNDSDFSTGSVGTKPSIPSL